ncbi:MAG: class I SAM-dependent methyltransferase [Bacteroidales bacterium]|jgi:SAM-dependent methyltransferase|nr:class I SAM-dependent methyltransferase [Bacteroidales bacterium]
MTYPLQYKKDTKNIKCPLCNKTAENIFFNNKGREYYNCKNCKLIYVNPNQYLSSNDEKSRYDIHQNDSADSGYRSFLQKIFYPMQECINPKSSGLDFGSGPDPTLSLMFEEEGHKMEIFDIFYNNNPSVLKNRQYDFITLSEVIEHLHKPMEVLNKLWSCLKQNGHLGIMTKFSPGIDNFPKWYYKNDETHICFYSKNTFLWIAQKLNASIHLIEEDIVILTKTDS